MIIAPSKKNIRRIYNTGIWLNLQSSDYTSQIHAKINDLQIDSQIDNSIFPVVFAPVPPPKTIAKTGMFLLLNREICQFFVHNFGLVLNLLITLYNINLLYFRTKAICGTQHCRTIE